MRGFPVRVTVRRMGGKSNKGRKVKAPVERLDHNHRRLEQELATLNSCSAAIGPNHAESEANWDGVEEVLAYLKRSVVRHELDEEESVFPFLAEHPALRPLLRRLSDDHASQGKLVDKLAVLVEERDTTKATKLRRVVKALRTLYLDHVKREDRELLPAMGRHLSAAQLSTIATEMANRRD